jgi:uncharacterized protein YlxW (UPF0749 family)
MSILFIIYRLHRVTSELDHYQAMNQRFKTENEKLDKENGREQEKYRQLINKQKAFSSKLKTEREEVTIQQLLCLTI